MNQAWKRAIPSGILLMCEYCVYTSTCIMGTCVRVSVVSDVRSAVGCRCLRIEVRTAV
jgi:hypothetical protein